MEGKRIKDYIVYDTDILVVGSEGAGQEQL